MKQQTQTNKIEWKKVKLGDLAIDKKFSIVDGPFGTQLHSDEYIKEGIPLIRVTNILSGKFNFEDLKYISEKKFQELIRSEAKEGDLLISKTGTIGRTCKFPKEFKKAIVSSSCAKLTLNKNIVNLDYMVYYLNSNIVYNQLLKVSKGTTRLGFNLTALRNIKIVVPFFSDNTPDLKEQERIVSILEKAEKQKERGKKVEELLDEYLKSVFWEMFYNKGFEEVELGDKKICEIAGEYGSGAGAIEYNGKTRYIRITDIGEDGKLRNEIVSPSSIENKYLLKIGDLLFARTGATVGKTYLHNSNEKNYQYAGYLIRFRFNETIIPEYVYYFTKTNKYLYWVASVQKVVAQPNINAKQYSSLKIPLPPLPLQQKFAKIVEHVERLKENIKKTNANSEELFNSLMSKAFRGEL